MRRSATFFSLLATSLLLACTAAEPPAIGEPQPMGLPAGKNVLGPRFTSGVDGTVLLSWMRREQEGATLRFSRLELGKWQPAQDVVTDESMFVNWADLPSVQALNDEHWVAHWLSKSAAETYAYDVLLAFSADRGQNWSQATRPHIDGTTTEHGFVSIYPQEDTAALLWLDGRKTVAEATDNPRDSGMTLRAAAVAPGGTLSNEQLVDDIVCDCCQTDIAISANGPIAVYRNRTVGEVRDIYVSRFANGAWEPGMPIADDGWEIAGCPVNGPAIDAQDKLVAIAWFSAANDKPVVRLVLSSNAGKTFAKPLDIAAGRVSGHVGVAIIDRSSVAVSWVESDKRGTNAINIRTATTGGLLGPAKTVGRTDLLRIYPQLIRSDDNLLLAWTDEISGATELAAIRVPLPGFYDR